MQNMKEIRAAVESVCNEKGVEEKVVLDAIELALATANQRRYAHRTEFRVSINWDKSDYNTFRVWVVVDDAYLLSLAAQDSSDDDDAMSIPAFDSNIHMTFEQAREKDANLEIGAQWEEQVESVPFGRIVAQTAKQVILQKVREAERERVVREYLPRVGQLVSGTVRRSSRDSVIVDLGNNAEGVLTRENSIPRDKFRRDDRLKAYLVEVMPDSRGPQLILSRTVPEMLIELFKIEVPEIAEEIIEIKAAARDPGERAKIAVTTTAPRIDAVGACVGMRGSRVQAVSGELAGERVDVVPWDDNPVQFVINAIGPTEVEQIVVDEDLRTMDIAVTEDKVALAIGIRGQNVRLAGDLTGWTLNIMAEEEAVRKRDEEITKCVELFMTVLEVDDEVAGVLALEGFQSVEEVAYVPLEEMQQIEGFDEELVRELRERAKNSLHSRDLSDLVGGVQPPAEDLINMEGMDDLLAKRLASNGIVTMEDLAEQDIAALLEIDASLGEERAGRLIMAAREPWFAE